MTSSTEMRGQQPLAPDAQNATCKPQLLHVSASGGSSQRSVRSDLSTPLVYALLALILVLGAGLRLYHLSSVPTELIVDEIDLYNSVDSIVRTGHDLDGALKPFLYSQFTRNPPLYGVAGYVSSVVFGKTVFALRLPAVAFGLLATFVIFFLVRELTGRRDVALIAALFMCVQPIFVQFSRIAWEPSSELPFFLGGLYFLVRSIRMLSDPTSNARKTSVNVALAAILLALTCYTYMSGWFYVVILSVGLAALQVRCVVRSAKSAAIAFGGGCLWLLVAAPALQMIFIDPLTGSKISRVSTFAHGVTFDALKVFAGHYVAHFGFGYLVLDGDPQPGTTWRYLNGFGAFYWWILPLAAVGLAGMSRFVCDRRLRAWLWLWLLAYPLAGALTNDGGPNAPRTLAGAPVFCILAAIGWTYCYDWAAAKGVRFARWGFGISFAALASSVALFATFYFTQYVHRNPNAWGSGTRAMFAAVEEYRPNYDRVCFSVFPAWYGINTYLRFYMPNDVGAIPNALAPACSLPGTLLVTDNGQRKQEPGFKYLTAIRDVNGMPFVTITGRPREGARYGRVLMRTPTQ